MDLWSPCGVHVESVGEGKNRVAMWREEVEQRKTKECRCNIRGVREIAGNCHGNVIIFPNVDILIPDSTKIH